MDRSTSSGPRGPLQSQNWRRSVWLVSAWRAFCTEERWRGSRAPLPHLREKSRRLGRQCVRRPRRSEAMAGQEVRRGRLAGVVALLALAATVALSWALQRPPTPVPASAAPTEFSAQRAYADLGRVHRRGSDRRRQSDARITMSAT